VCTLEENIFIILLRKIKQIHQISMEPLQSKTWDLSLYELHRLPQEAITNNTEIVSLYLKFSDKQENAQATARIIQISCK
jgi:hypothetical protein